MKLVKKKKKKGERDEQTLVSLLCSSSVAVQPDQTVSVDSHSHVNCRLLQRCLCLGFWASFALAH